MRPVARQKDAAQLPRFSSIWLSSPMHNNSHEDTEFKLMRKIGSSWTQGALRRVFLKWAEWAKDNVEKRLILAAFEEETAVISMFGEENKKKLLAMEAAKWEEGYDAYEERYFYTHTETGEVVWDERPLDREFVLRVK